MAIPKVGSVDEFIEIHPEYLEELKFLRSLLIETELEEKIKWMFPCYTFDNKNVIGLGAFKKYVGLWFYQGVFLSDPLGILVNAQEGKTKAMRQWRFQELSEIKKHKNQIRQYLAEAIQNQKDGKEILPTRVKKELIIPEELLSALAKSKRLKGSFEKLTYGKKKEYAEYISTAKRVETKEKRLKKITPMILEGKGLNDKYK